MTLFITNLAAHFLKMEEVGKSRALASFLVELIPYPFIFLLYLRCSFNTSPFSITHSVSHLACFVIYLTLTISWASSRTFTKCVHVPRGQPSFVLSPGALSCSLNQFLLHPTSQNCTATAAMTDQQQDVSGSPNSSVEVDSHPGTPATKLSAFSPEDFQTQQKVSALDAGRKTLPPAFTLRPVPVGSSPKAKVQIPSLFGNSDPFITASTASFITKSFHYTPKLSPSASTFTPIGLRENVLDTFGNSTSTLDSPTFKADGNRSIVDSPTALLEAKTASSQPELKKLLYSVANSALVYPKSQSSTSFLKPSSTGIGPIGFGQFSSDSKLSRSLMISHVARNTTVELFDTFFNVRGRYRSLQSVANIYVAKDFSSLKRVVLSELLLSGTVYVSFADIRDAGKAYDKIQSARQDWKVQHIATTQISTQGQPQGLMYPPGSAYESQVVVKAEYTGHEDFRAGEIGSLIKDLLANYGDIMAYSTDRSTTSSLTYRAEFYNTIAADNALAYLNGFKLAVRILSTSM